VGGKRETEWLEYWGGESKLNTLIFSALQINWEIYSKRFVVPKKRFRFAAAFEGGSDTISVKIEPKNVSSLQVVLVFGALEKKGEKK